MMKIMAMILVEEDLKEGALEADLGEKEAEKEHLATTRKRERGL